MKFYLVEPEVAGGFGANTRLDASVHPPRVDHLHYQIDGWLGDELLETFPCYIVTEALRDVLAAEGVTGISFTSVEVSKSSECEGLQPNLVLPPFVRVQITGKAGCDDVGLASDSRLVVSDRVLEVLKKHHVDHAKVEDYP